MTDKNSYDDVIACVEGVIGVPEKSTDVMKTHVVDVPAPLPCIVILIHGVNDVGEAFPNLDKGICAGLNKRLGRNDLKPNKWKWTQTDHENFSPRMQMFTEWTEPKIIKVPLKPCEEKHKGNSPIIPFYWGYRPVDIDSYYAEQEAYEERLKKDKKAELPYDAYWVERETKELKDMFGFSKLSSDQFGNWIDHLFTRNGGPFSDATTCIPDMYGPGLTSMTNFVATLGSPKGSKAYENPHRIYMVFAAYRLANLIKNIRDDDKLKHAPINIVAHSQGTIITMLANLMLKDENYLPADCVIMAHSPYAFDGTFLEGQSKEHGMAVQTNKAREQTFINFVDAIEQGQNLREKTFKDPKVLIEKYVASPPTKPDLLNPTTPDYDFTNPLYWRYNFGKVYNYFSPNDQVVSLKSIQGMGWQGIPNYVFKQCGDNLRQRAFGHGFPVGENPDKFIFFRPSGTFKIDLPTYIDRKALHNRYLEIVNDNKITTRVFLTQDEISLINQHNPVKNGRYHNGYYDILKSKLIIQYKINDEDLERLKQDQQSGLYSPTETGSDSIFDANRYSNASYAVEEQLKVNGEQVPIPITYTGCGKSPQTELAKAIYYHDLFIQQDKYRHYENDYKKSEHYKPYPKYEFEYRGPNRPKKSVLGSMVYKNVIDNHYQWKRDREAEHPEWKNVVHYRFTDDPYKFEVWCFPDEDEIRQRVYEDVKTQASTPVDSSHHSGITLHKQVPSHIMAYDLALGEVNIASKANQRTWHRLINNADWRSRQNEDKETIFYQIYGILPDGIKKSMNLLKGTVPKSVVNEFRFVFSLEGTYSLMKDTVTNLPTKIPDITRKHYPYMFDKDIQWPMPEPITKRRNK